LYPQITAETLEAVKAALLGPGTPLEKATTSSGITTGSGLYGYNLEAPSKKLFPVLSPLRNRFARVRGFGNAVEWKAITAINADGLDGFVAEGARNSLAKTTVDPKTAAYKSLDNEGKTTFEAIAAGRNFEDVHALDVANTLSGLMVMEEHAILGGNVTAVGKPAAMTTPYGAADASGAGPFTATTAYDFAVSAKTMSGLKATGHAAADAVGESDGRTLTTFTTGSAKTSVTLSWGAVRGAVAYNVFIGTHSGTLYYAFTTTQTSITINNAVLAALPGSGNVPNTGDQTANALAFDGIIAQLTAAGSNAYFKDLAGATLTGNNAGGISEWDTALKDIYDRTYVSPTLILVSSQEAQNSITKIAANGSTTVLRINATVGADGVVAGGLRLGSYLNKYGGREVEIMTHPFLPAGMVIMLTETLPYADNNVPNVFEIDARQDYTQVEYGLATRAYEYGVWASEVLKVYFPAGCAILTGIANG
jgi:hypothetical protein